MNKTSKSLKRKNYFYYTWIKNFQVAKDTNLVKWHRRICSTSQTVVGFCCYIKKQRPTEKGPAQRIMYQREQMITNMTRRPPYPRRDIAGWNHGLTVSQQQLAKTAHRVPLEKGPGWGCKLAQPPGREWLVSWLMAGMLVDQHLSNISPKRVATWAKLCVYKDKRRYF